MGADVCVRLNSYKEHEERAHEAGASEKTAWDENVLSGKLRREKGCANGGALSKAADETQLRGAEARRGDEGRPQIHGGKGAIHGSSGQQRHAGAIKDIV